MRILTPALRRTDSTPDPTFPRLFDELFGDWPFGASGLERAATWRPATDIFEKDGNLLIRLEVPGLGEKDIELKLERNVLTLKGERKAEHDPKSTHRLESFYGTFTRSFTLPETVDTDKITAEVRNGVLTVTLPQRPEVKPREIPVSVH